MTNREAPRLGRPFTTHETLLVRRLLHLSAAHEGHHPYYSRRVIMYWWGGEEAQGRALDTLLDVGIIESHRYLPTVYRLAPRFLPTLRELVSGPEPLTGVRV